GCDTLRQPIVEWEDEMLHRCWVGLLALAALAGAATTAAHAQALDAAKYPDWSGKWRGIGGERRGPAETRGRRPAPAPDRGKASLADQRAGGPGNDMRFSCLPPGMPRMMTAIFPMEFIFTPKITYILFENLMPRRIYTDGRDWPKEADAAFAGYSLGRWVDEDGDGRYDVLEIETRNMKGPGSFEPSGLPLHRDDQTVVKERIHLDKANVGVLLDDITTIDNALSRPWTVTKQYRRDGSPFWFDNNCTENNPHILIGKEAYYLSADGYLMPAKKGQV